MSRFIHRTSVLVVGLVATVIWEGGCSSNPDSAGEGGGGSNGSSNTGKFFDAGPCEGLEYASGQ